MAPQPQNNAQPTIYLTRHESTLANDGPNKRLRGWRDFQIDDPGRRDLIKLANWFTAHPISHVVAADLSRHIETGLAIARKQHATFTPTFSFRPWDNTEAWGHRELNKSLYREMQHYIDNADKPLPKGGETYNTFHGRHTADGFNTVAQYAVTHPAEHIALITSTRGIGDVLATITGDRNHIVGKDIVAPGGVVKMTHSGQAWTFEPIRKPVTAVSSINSNKANGGT